MKQIQSKIRDYVKSGFFKGVGLGLGIMATSLFAAAAAMNVFSSGEVISSAKINQNFAIAAPEGAVIAFYLNNCPEGWAPADGTNGTPDLRGQFVRGRDNVGTGAAGKDPAGSRLAGSVQGDAFQGHRHSIDSRTVIFGQVFTGYHFEYQGYPGAIGNVNQINAVLEPIPDGINGDPRIANETRPSNVALTYCMRKN